MAIPLHRDEQPYNCALVPAGLRRERASIEEGEATEGTCIVWRVLGFGGKPNPLVYSRAASFAMRTAQACEDEGNGARHGSGFSVFGLAPFKPSSPQALFRQSPTKTDVWLRGQLYVDDPAICARGPAREVQKAFDVLLAWWLALGIPLAWTKGAVHWDDDQYDWIGVTFARGGPGQVVMSLPSAFLEDFLTILRPFCRRKGLQRLADAEKLVGKAGRIAYIVPAARPFVGGLYAALAGAKAQLRTSGMRVPGDWVATRRFATSACWLKAAAPG